MTTLTPQDLREYLVGAWTLESYQSSDLDGTNMRYPLGADARGIIMYTADGYMSAQIMRADRAPFARGDLQATVDPVMKLDRSLAKNSATVYTTPLTLGRHRRIGGGGQGIPGVHRSLQRSG